GTRDEQVGDGVGRRGADGAGVTDEPGLLDPPVRPDRQHHAHAIAAERVDVLGDRVGARHLAAMTRLAPPLADDVAVDAVGRGGRRATHSSSPRTAFALYGGERIVPGR